MTDFPYPGLRPFQADENHLFFGREQHVNQLITRLEQTHFLAVVGLSGCGKSSLIRAGLLADLETGFCASAGTRWQIAEMRPSHRPLTRLAEALLATTFGQAYMPDLGSAEASAFLQAELQRLSLLGLHPLLQETPLPDETNLLIFVDQFEEIFRYYQEVDKEEAQKFVALLLSSSQTQPFTASQNNQKKPGIYVIIAMRSDFIGNCALFPGLPEAINRSQFLIPRLTREQLREAIVTPARVFAGNIDDILVNQLLNDAGTDFDQLPLLQHALMRMWTLQQQRGALPQKQAETNGIVLTMTHYQAIGGWNHALSKHADEAYAELAPAQQKIAEVLFRSLTERDKDRRDTRRPVKLAEIATLANVTCEQVIAVVEIFRQEGRSFLTPPVNKVLEPDTIIDISHESLIRQWQRLKEWVEKEAQLADFYQHLEDSALRWEKGQTALWRTPELENALAWSHKAKPTAHWAQRYGQNFELAMRFLAESAQEQKREQQIKQKVQQQELQLARKRVIWAIMGLIVTTGLALWGFWERYNALLAQQETKQIEQERTNSLFESRLTHASLLAQGEDYAQATQIVNKTYELDQEIAAPRRHVRNLLAWFNKLMGGGTLQQIYQSINAQLYTLAISPDGNLLAVGGENSNLMLFDTKTNQLLHHLTGHHGDIHALVFQPQQQWLVSAGTDKRIIFWSLSTGTKIKEWQTSAEVHALAINSEGTYLASGGTDRNITLWEIETGKKLRTFSGHTASISEGGLAFHPTQKLLASGSYDNTVRLWNITNGKILHVLKGHTKDVANITFSPDGKQLATSSDDGIIRLWDIHSGQPHLLLQGHKNRVVGLRFVENGRYLVSASFDRTLRIWDTASGVTVRVLQKHTAPVTNIAIHAQQIFSISHDNTVKRWSTALPYQQIIDFPSDVPISAALAPNGKHVAIGFADGTLRLYSLPKARLWWEQKVHTYNLLRLAFSPDSTLLASASFNDKTVKIWKLTEAELTAQHTFPHNSYIHSLAFSPQGNILATASDDGQIGLFPVTKPQQPIFYQAHQGRVSAVDFNVTDNAKLLSGGADGYTRLWQINNNPPTLLTQFQALDEIMWTAISPNGLEMASVGSKQVIHLYTTPHTQKPKTLGGYEQTIYRVIFSPDSQQLATASGNGTVRFWDLTNGQELFTLRLPIRTCTTTNTPEPLLWDFDFRCTAQKCWIVVPLPCGKVALYDLGKIYD